MSATKTSLHSTTMRNTALSAKKNMRKKQRIAAHKKYEEKANQEHEENIIRIRNSNARIAAIVIEAKKAGLTYGNYMRLKGATNETN